MLKPLPLLFAIALPLALAGAALSPVVATGSAGSATPAATVVPVAAFRPTVDQQGAARMVYGVLSDSRYAYAPRPLDDTLSAAIYRRYLESLDSQKLFFTQADIDAFQKNERRFDDAIKGQSLQPAFDLYHAARAAHCAAAIHGEAHFFHNPTEKRYAVQFVLGQKQEVVGKSNRIDDEVNGRTVVADDYVALAFLDVLLPADMQPNTSQNQESACNNSV